MNTSPLYKKIVPDGVDKITGLATDAVAEGYTTLKLLTTYQASPMESTADIDAICEYLDVAREAVGREIDIGIDLHGHISARLVALTTRAVPHSGRA